MVNGDGFCGRSEETTLRRYCQQSIGGRRFELLLVLLIAGASALAEERPVRLAHFQLTSILSDETSSPLQFRRISLNDGRITVAAQLQNQQGTLVAQVDYGGRLLWKRQIRSQIADIRVQSTGSVSILTDTEEAGQQILRIDEGGGSTQAREFTDRLATLVDSDGHIGALDYRGNVQGLTRSERPIFPISGVDLRGMVLQWGNNRLAVIDATRASVTIADLQTGNTHVFDLVAPDVEQAKKHYREIEVPRNSVPLVVQAAGTNRSELYVLLSGFTAEEGLPLLTYGTDGKLRRTVRLPMLLGNRAIVPVGLAAEGDIIALLGADGTVLMFSWNSQSNQ